MFSVSENAHMNSSNVLVHKENDSCVYEGKKITGMDP